MNIKRLFLPPITKLYRYLGGCSPDIENVIVLRDNEKWWTPAISINGVSGYVLSNIHITKIDNHDLYNHIYDLIQSNSNKTS